MIKITLNNNEYYLKPGVNIPDTKYFYIIVSSLSKANYSALFQYVISSWERPIGSHSEGRSIDISRVVTNDSHIMVADMNQYDFNYYFDTFIKYMIETNQVSQILTPFGIYDLRNQNTNDVLSWTSTLVPRSLQQLELTHKDHIHITWRRV